MIGSAAETFALSIPKGPPLWDHAPSAVPVRLSLTSPRKPWRNPAPDPRAIPGAATGPTEEGTMNVSRRIQLFIATLLIGGFAALTPCAPDQISRATVGPSGGGG
jgi:hypothetical protein